MSLRMNWEDFWNWFESIDTVSRKAEVLKEIDHVWISALSAKIQAEIFMHAPEEIQKSMKLLPKIFKRDAIILIQMAHDRKDKRMRKYSK